VQVAQNKFCDGTGGSVLVCLFRNDPHANNTNIINLGNLKKK